MRSVASKVRTPARRALAIALMALSILGCSDQQSSGNKEASAPKQRAGEPGSSETARAVPRGNGFDFYVLSLSWSPTWCAENDAEGRSDQCGSGRYPGFIVHGLWPQNERGYPSFCPSREPDRVSEQLGRRYLDIIPSMGLIGHQWRKHGSCSGLNQAEYFSVVRAARERVTIPDSLEAPNNRRPKSPAEIEKVLIGANPGLSASAIGVTCEGNRLEELRICMTPDLEFRSCPEVDRASCRLKSVTQPAMR
ncbi:ribonuclease [Sinorhizobium sp. BG8]|nr:ribonuclease [Sinorhizobium sp. BG8]